jgi:hypothetical protein
MPGTHPTTGTRSDGKAPCSQGRTLAVQSASPPTCNRTRAWSHFSERGTNHMSAPDTTRHRSPLQQPTTQSRPHHDHLTPQLTPDPGNDEALDIRNLR